jgi:hypothetical protein
MSEPEPWVPIHWEALDPSGDGIHPQLPNPAYLPAFKANLLVARALNLMSESTMNKGLHPDDLRVTIEPNVDRGSSFPGGVWDMNYPRNEWWCDFMRALGARAHP